LPTSLRFWCFPFRFIQNLLGLQSSFLMPIPSYCPLVYLLIFFLFLLPCSTSSYLYFSAISFQLPLSYTCCMSSLYSLWENLSSENLLSPSR
jgi:hypothetical protein